MRTDYSKPSADIAVEALRLQAEDQDILATQKRLATILEQANPRSACLLCGSGLDAGVPYRHRDVSYVFCSTCGHLQTKVQPPQGYPYEFSGQGFYVIYPKLDQDAYRSRRDRVYMPKLDWAISCMSELHSVKELRDTSWCEIGCGAGYFLSALQSKGVKSIRGLDADRELVSIANQMLGDNHVQHTSALLDDLRAAHADIYAAFFVLEHIEQAQQFWEIMSDKPTGTLFVFSVPTYGFAALLENAFHNFAARSLDSVFHTQMYTEQSLGHALMNAGYDTIAEWLFGQDAQDLCRVLATAMNGAVPAELAVSHAKTLVALMDPLQEAIDRARSCDARHLLVRKR